MQAGEFGFKQLKLHRVEAHCVADNNGSIRVLEKLSLQREGHLREKSFFKERYWDELIYAILEKEFLYVNQAKPTVRK